MAVILITGAAKRIGHALATSLGKNHTIIVHYNQSKSEAIKTVNQIRTFGSAAVHIQQDLFLPNAAETLFHNAINAFNEIDVIINCASIFMPDTIDKLSHELWQQNQAIHVTVPMMLTQLLYQNYSHSEANKDKQIINIIDQRIKRPTPQFFSYTASKLFLGSLTQQCAISCSPYVRVNGISPGATLPSSRQSQDEFTQQAKLTPLERAVSINDVIHAVDFLIKCPSVTGEIITLDGGQNFDWRTQSFLECKE